MSDITGVLIGTLLLCVFDYMWFREEGKRWQWFTKKTRMQKIGLLITVFIAFFILNYVFY
jgi:hypothetical protein